MRVFDIDADSLGIFVISQIIAFIPLVAIISAAGGSILVTSAISDRSTSAYLLRMLFWTSLILWSMSIFFSQVTSATWLYHIITTLTLFVTGLYYFFIVHLTQTTGILRHIIVPIFVWISVVSVTAWLNLLYVPNPSGISLWGAPTIFRSGYVAAFSNVGVTVLALWTLLNSSTYTQVEWRFPVILWVIASATLIFPSPSAWLVGLWIVALGTSWFAWLILRNELLAPVVEKQTEIAILTADLQRALGEVAQEKSINTELEAEIKQTNKRKRDFLEAMSHQLRTPLHTIVGFSELLQEGTYGSIPLEQLNRLEKINQNGKHLLMLMTHIVELNKMEAGQLKLDMVATDISTIIEAVALKFINRFKAKDIKFTVLLECDPFTVVVDHQRITQVLDQLLDNALTFTSEGYVTLQTINVVVREGSTDDFPLPVRGWLRNGNWLLITVTDTGIGIAPEDQHWIFEAFSQPRLLKEGENRGMGLGLAVSHKLIELHNGIIWVKSQVATGTSIYIALPTINNPIVEKRDDQSSP